MQLWDTEKATNPFTFTLYSGLDCLLTGFSLAHISLNSDLSFSLDKFSSP